MKVRMDDGTEAEGEPDDIAVIPPWHNVCVVGDEPCVMIDFTGAKDYAKKNLNLFILLLFQMKWNDFR